jgi:uncharacterized membrane protein
MYSRLKLVGHPLHPILVTLPVAFYSATLAAFAVYAVTLDAFTFRVAVVANVAGVVTALVAAVPGLVDWRWGLPADHPAKAIGLLHMALNITALAAFAVNAGIQLSRWDAVAPAAGSALALSIAGFVFTLLAGYLGGEMVQRHHVGIDLTAEQARIDVARAAHPARRVHPAVRGL